jgi:nucleoid-associated protein YgaU
MKCLAHTGWRARPPDSIRKLSAAVALLAPLLLHPTAPRLRGRMLRGITAGLVGAALWLSPVAADSDLPREAGTTAPATATWASTAMAVPELLSSAEPVRRTYVVRARPDESLWRIAARRLGDPERWTEIYALNRGRLQPDGRRLTSPDLIRPGWRLRLPTDASRPSPRATDDELARAAEAIEEALASARPAYRAAARSLEQALATARPATRPYRVRAREGRPADTLWRIAARRLGDPERWTEIYALNWGRLQPDGRRLTSPDLIRPGWRLRLPADPSPSGVLP